MKSFNINKFFGVAQLLDHTVTSISATGSHLLVSGSVCNDAKTRTGDDTAAVTASSVSRNGHLICPAAPPHPLNHQKPILVVYMDHTLSSFMDSLVPSRQSSRISTQRLPAKSDSSL